MKINKETLKNIEKLKVFLSKQNKETKNVKDSSTILKAQ